MKLIFSKYLTAVGSLLLIVIGGCEKKVDPIDTYYVTVEYKNSNPNCITDDKEINPGDSIYFDFTVTSEEEMAFVEIQKNGFKLDTFSVPAGKKTFSAIKSYKADTAAGNYSYRILARDKGARFLGDGGKLMTITVKPDFHFWSYRIMAVPDTVDKTNKCYYSISTGQTLSYTQGTTHSGAIDFGYYFDTATTIISNKRVPYGHTIYALNAPQKQLDFYDISSWTKNATVFKKMSIDFAKDLTSASAINTKIKNSMSSGTLSKVNLIAGGHVYGFKTVTGKYGAILIRYFNKDSPEKTTYIDIDVKVQK